MSNNSSTLVSLSHIPDDYKSTFNINDYKVICEKDEIFKDNEDEENLIDSADDDEGAANYVVKNYKDRLLICDKVLNVYNADCASINLSVNNVHFVPPLKFVLFRLRKILPLDKEIII